MDKIKLEGKFIGYGNGEGLPAWIELSSPELKKQLKPDLSQIKKGDEVWIKMRVGFKGERQMTGIDGEGSQTPGIPQTDIIAHFPSEPEKKKAEPTNEMIRDYIKENLKVELPEKIVISPCWDTPMLKIARTLNQVIVCLECMKNLEVIKEKP